MDDKAEKIALFRYGLVAPLVLAVAAACARLSFPVEIAEFFPDLPARIAVCGCAPEVDAAPTSVGAMPFTPLPSSPCWRSKSFF